MVTYLQEQVTLLQEQKNRFVGIRREFR